jgi:hypothetical protein
MPTVNLDQIERIPAPLESKEACNEELTKGTGGLTIT